VSLRVIDSSVILAALVGTDAQSAWALEQLGQTPLAAPYLVHVEIANRLRKLVFEGKLSSDAATLAHSEAVELPIELFPYVALAERVWSLRANVSAYDAWYVALAELLEAPLLTLDHRLVRADGPRCTFHTLTVPERSM
jgi:predicted nucleic acid-binding protein